MPSINFLTSTSRIKDSLFPSFVTNGLLKTGPATPNTAWEIMYKRWELPVYLNGGTLAMREAKEKWLPIEEGEEPRLYENRLLRTVLFGAYSKTIKTLSDLPFNCPVQINELDEELEYLIEAANGDDEDLVSFCKQLLRDLLDHGIAHILVEHPVSEGELSLAEERELGIRPYFSRINPLKLIGWDSERQGSRTSLSEIRIFEDIVKKDPNNEWGEIDVQQVRIVRPGVTQIYETSSDNSGAGFELVETLETTTSKIMLVTIYGNKTGFMQGAPALEELAWQNLRHYQKLSDLDNIEHVANVPFALGTGIPENEMNNITIGSHRLLKCTSENADIKYVEHSGAAISASQASLRDLEARMVAMGAEIIQSKVSTRETATGKSIDSNKSVSTLQQLVINLEEGLAKAFVLAGEWIDKEIEPPSVNIGDKLSLSVEANLVTSLIDLARQGNMSFEDLANELKRRNMISTGTSLKKSELKPELTDPLNPLTEGGEEEEPKEEEEESTKEEEKQG